MNTTLNLNHEMYGSSSLIDARFYELVRERGCVELRDVDWSADPDQRPVALESLVPALVARSDTMTRALLVGDDAIAVVGFANTSPRVDLSVAATTKHALHALIDEVMAAIAPVKPGPTQVDVEFWTSPGRGAMWRRQLEMVTWGDIRANYHSDTATELEALFDTPSFDGGKLILWHGEPGTGKTHALRALMARHGEVATFHYVTDPEHFFGDRGDYMLRVLLDGAEAGERWKLVILEDAGELLAVDAREQVGQALSRLLNTCDGLVGQGLRLIVLITTNEDVGKMHPAVTRPGRCLSNVQFRRFDVEAATLWLKRRGVETPAVDAPRTIAQLYAELSGGDTGGAPPRRFGF